jgi:hypothetical protein
MNMNLRGIATATPIIVAAVSVPLQMPLHAQSFGMAKTKVTLQRKLPALTQLPANTIQVRVTTINPINAEITRDLQAQLATELVKDDPKLQETDANPAILIVGEVTSFSPPQRTVGQRAASTTSMIASEGQVNTQNYVRVAGGVSIAFQVKTSAGAVLVSDNIAVNYDQEFDVPNNAPSGGLMGGMTGSVTSGLDRFHHKSNSTEGGDDKPPTDAELRQKLVVMAVNRMAAHVVNTNESITAFLAKDKGAIDEGDKAAEAGLWERALESFETAPALPKKEEDAYRLYNIGVADEALGYAAQDPKSAMKLLDDAAINYGKAIDDKPSEKYFLDPQKRIETAIDHYRKLQQEQAAAGAPPPAPAPAPVSAPVASRSLQQGSASPAAATTPAHPVTNQQVIAMVRAGMDDDTVVQTVKAAKAVNFDLTPTGRKHLADSGVDAAVINAMKARAIQDLATQ